MEKGSTHEKEISALRSFSVLSCSWPGQLYNGKLKKGIWVYVISMLLLIFAFFAYRHFGFAGLIGGTLLVLGFALFAIFDGYREARALGSISLAKYNKFFVYLLIILSNGIAVVPYVVAQNHVKPFMVPTGSMQPTIMVGDFIMADMTPPFEIRRGDVVVLAFANDEKVLFFKRILGMPGETIEIRGKQILINGKAIDDPWGFYEHQEEDRHISSGPVVIPDNRYFALGDNRDNSMDSRQWGCVEKADIHGRPLYICWSKDMHRIGKNIA